MKGFNQDNTGNILITPMYIPHEYTTQHYTGFPLKSLGHSWHKPHFYEIFNISAYKTHTSLLHTPIQVHSIGTPTYSLWLRFILLHALISDRHSSRLYTDSLWTGMPGVRKLVGRIFSTRLPPASSPRQWLPWFFPGVKWAGRGF